MIKEIITFSAIQQTLMKTGGIDCFAGETVEYVEAQFDLGENWTGYDHIDAIWTNDGNFTQIATVLSPEGTCRVPTEVLKSMGEVRVNLVGTTSESDDVTERLTTYPIFALGVNANVPLTGTETQPITASQFDQFVQQVINEVEKVTGMTAEAITLPPGSDATAEYRNGKLIIGIPQGIQGEKGDTGETGNGIASVIYNADYSLTFRFTNGEEFRTPPLRGERGPQGIQGIQGKKGDTGATPRIQIGTVETLPAGSDAEVTVTGTPEDPRLNFKLPEGKKGDTGATPNIKIGTVETLPAGSDAEATITGTPEDPELNLKIPKGDTGEVTLEDLESLLPVDTASGNIISIPDGQPVIPVQSLKVQLDPVQDLHGYDRPWAAGAGKNLYDMDSDHYGEHVFWVVTNGTLGSNEQYYASPKIPVKPSTQYTRNEGANANCFFKADGTFLSFASTGKTFTTPSDCYFVAFNIANDVDHNTVQLELGSTATAYEPYSNICPIDGWTDADTHRTGVNVWDEEYLQGYYSSTGTFVSNTTQICSKNLIPVVGNAEYRLVEGTRTSGTNTGGAVCYYDADGTFIFRASQTIGAFTTPMNCRFIHVNFGQVYGAIYLNDISINYPSTDTEYHQYDGKTIHTEIEGNYTVTSTDKVPYLLKEVGDIDGDRLREKIIGGTVNWNQLIPNTKASDTVAGNVVITNNGDGSWTFSGNATSSVRYQFASPRGVINHIYAVFGIEGGSRETYYFVDTAQGALGSSIVNETVFKSTQNFNQYSVRFISGNTFDTPITIKPQLFDLTAMLGPTIADYIYSIEQATAGAGVAWFKEHFAPNDYYPYNSGEMLSVQTSAHVTKDANGNVIGNYLLDSSKTLQGIFKLDANNNLYADGDIYYPSEGIDRRYGIVDLGTLNWRISSSRMLAQNLSPAAKDIGTSTMPNAVCSQYEPIRWAWVDVDHNGTFCVTANQIIVMDSRFTDPVEFKTAMNGVQLVYELATPTTESAEPFAEIQKVISGGTEEYIDEREVPVPVGHETEYLSRETYGCTIDIVSGECVIDRGVAVFDGTEPYSDNYFPTIVCGKEFPQGTGSGANYICNYAPPDTYYYNYANTLKRTFQFSRINTAWMSNDLASFKAKLVEWNSNGEPLTIIYPLAEPITIQFTPEEIHLLLGDNTIWSDGPVTLIYNADVARWIAKKLAS